MKPTQTERGQLILAGAVSFALILIAIAVVFSTTLFTASVGSSGSVETVSDSTAIEQSVNKTTAELLDRTNDRSDDGWRNETLEDEFEKEITAYNELLSEGKVNSSPTFVDVSVDDTGFVDDPDPVQLDWVQIRLVYETADVERETVLKVNAS